MKNRLFPLGHAAQRAGAALFLALATLLSGPPAQAQQFGINDIVHAEILPGWQARDGSRMAALRLSLNDGWYTYWRIPGDAGLVPRFNWSASQNIQSVEPIWPAPEVYEQYGLRSIIYREELILPLRIQPVNPDRPMTVRGDLSIGVCRETCIPADLEVSASLRGAGQADERISASLALRPQPAENAGLRRTTCRMEPAARGTDLTLRATLPRVGPDEFVVMELPNSGYWVSNTRTWREGGDLLAQARVSDPSRGPVGVSRSALAFSILSRGRVVESTGCVGG